MYADGPMDTFSGMRTEVKYKPQLIEAVTHPVTITVARSFAGIPVDLEKPWKVVVKLSYVSWEMPVRIRLARPPHRTKLTTHYHIVAIDGRKRRDAKPIEVLGVYDPVPRLPDEATKPWTIEDALPGRKKVELKPQKKIEWSVERLKYWLSVGAQPSKTVETLLEKGGLVPVKPKPQRAPTMQPSSLARLAAEQLAPFQSAAQQKTVPVTGS